MRSPSKIVRGRCWIDTISSPAEQERGFFLKIIDRAQFSSAVLRWQPAPMGYKKLRQGCLKSVTTECYIRVILHFNEHQVMET